ncbi:MAG: phosphotransferase, partial [Dehalococcoidia bacterium]
FDFWSRGDELLQPVLDIDELTAFLEQWAGGPVGGVEQFSNGQVSSVFSFDVVGDDGGDVGAGLRSADPDARSGRYVARFVSREHGEAVKKDRFIAPRAAAVVLPTPRLVKYGEVDLTVGNMTDEDKLRHSGEKYPLTFAICDLMPGEHMGELQDEERRHLIPAAVRAMDTISLIDISDTTGYGWMDSEGNGQHDSWAEYVAEEAFSREPGGFYDRRRSWFDDRGGFLEVDVFEHVSERMMSLVGALLEVGRSVVHIDFGYDNTLVIGNEVSAVLDWDNSIIGDHLYDGARYDLYAPELDFKQLFVERYAATGRAVPGLDDRWLVCLLHVGLQALGWYGVSNNEPAYHWMKARVLNVLGEGPPVGRHPDS